MSFSKRSAYAVGLLIALCVSVVVILGSAFVNSDSVLPGDYYNSLKTYVGSVGISTQSGASISTCPASCPSDPFVQPGMIHWSPKGLINETRWVPFPQEHYDWEPQEGYRFADVPLDDVVPPEAFGACSEQYTAQLNRGENIEWMRGRTILFIDDRNNVNQLCSVIDGEYHSWGSHTGGYCYLDRLDLVIVNWFLYGMLDDEKYPTSEERPFLFEQRIQQVMVPNMKENKLIGYDRRPDLVVVGSLFWDEGFIRKASDIAGRNREESLGFLWSEVAWHRSRVRTLIQTVRGLYGDSVPLMYRVRQIRQNTEHWGLLNIFQLDMSCRALAKELGVRLFTWAGKLEGFNKYYDNDQHFALGPNTYLFGDMTFFYLWRSILPGCWACHQWDD